jgi:catechol 2,3-dioxygenase-like lactoylglutathione lyase family enzyme
MRYAHTNIISHDWKKLANFYIEIFHCKIVPPIRNQSGDWLSRGTGVKNAKLQGAHLLLPGYGENGPTLEIYQYNEIAPLNEVNPNQRGIGHLAFEVDDVEQVLHQMETLGGKRFGSITDRVIEGVGKITFVYARDPDGNLIELQSWEK